MGKKIKILQVIGSLQMGGAENVAMNFARYLNKEKFQCDYLVYGSTIGEFEEEAKKLGSSIIRIPEPRDNYMNFFKNLKTVFRNGSYDIVHSHSLLNNGLIMKAAYDTGIKKRVSHSHSTDSGRKENMKYKMYKIIMKQLINKHTTDFVSCSLDAGNYLYSEKLFRKKGIIINNGVDTKIFNFNNDIRNKIRQQHNIERKTVIGHIGRFSAVKNHDFVLDIFNEVNKLEPNSILYLIGDGELKKEIYNKIILLGLEDKVIFTGNIPDVSEMLQAMDILVFPSLYEGLPVTLVEAQATGLKCLISENITSDIKITDLITFMSLKQTSTEWAKQLIMHSNYNRVDNSKEIRNKGYDIKLIINGLEKMYLS